MLYTLDGQISFALKKNFSNLFGCVIIFWYRKKAWMFNMLENFSSLKTLEFLPELLGHGPKFTFPDFKHLCDPPSSSSSGFCFCTGGSMLSASRKQCIFTCWLTMWKLVVGHARGIQSKQKTHTVVFCIANTTLYRFIKESRFFHKH